MQLTLITGNTHKLEEWRRIVPAATALDHHPLNLDEIQSLDNAEIIRHKVRQAYEAIGHPVVVEDVSCGLDKLNGLPGPFIKFFNERLGQDSLLQLGGEGAAATAICTVGYYDGTNEIIVNGTVHGTIVPARGNGFGFEDGFQPEGSTKTYGEMSRAEKDAASHRRLAIDELIARLKQL
jgi:inosine triphosphate pyrophosphatase